MTTPLTVDDLAMAHPVYTLNLTAAQRCTLEWITCNGGLYAPLHVDPNEIGEDCGNSVSTVYEALTRLTALRLLQRFEDGSYRVNPRFFFAQNPEVAQLVLDALEAPDVALDDRAQQPRRTSPGDVRRRQAVRPVS